MTGIGLWGLKEAIPYEWLAELVSEKLLAANIRPVWYQKDPDDLKEGEAIWGWDKSNYDRTLSFCAAVRHRGILARWSRIVKGEQPFKDPQTGEIWEKHFDLNWDHNLDADEIPDFQDSVAEQFVKTLLKLPRFMAHITFERCEGGIVAACDQVRVFNSAEERNAFVAEFPEGRMAVDP